MDELEARFTGQRAFLNQQFWKFELLLVQENELEAYELISDPIGRKFKFDDSWFERRRAPNLNSGLNSIQTRSIVFA